MAERKLCCTLGKRIDPATGQCNWSRKTAQCSDDVGVGVAIGWDHSGRLEMHLESSEPKGWRHLEYWAAESCLEAVAGSTWFVLL